MEKIFKDEKLQEQLDKDGFVSIPFLNDDELAELRAFYDEIHPSGDVPMYRDGGLHMTIWMKDQDYKIRIRDSLFRILGPAARRTYENFRIVSPVFIVKRSSEDSTFPIHQDWNVVDERKHRAFNMWIPLQDVDAHNGALWIVKGTQRLPNWVRGAGYLFPNFHGITDEIKPYMNPIPVKAGHALIFYHRVLHGSPPNLGGQPRAVAAMSILPEAVPLHIFFQPDAESSLEVYHPPDDFIYQYDNVRDDTPFQAPSGEPVKKLPSYRAEKITIQWFERNYSGKRSKGFASRLKSIFSWK